MRKRYELSVLAALILVAGGATVVYADPFGVDIGEPQQVTSGEPLSVTLPTGDVVTMKPGGGINVEAADDRDAGFVAPRSLDGSGDVVVIPSDKLPELAAGTEDPRRYNVSALLRSGQTDAAEADLSVLGDREYGQFTPVDTARPKADANAQKVNVTFTDQAGKTAVKVSATYVDLGTGEAGDFTVAEDGTASADLPTGRYDVLSSVYGTDGALVTAITPVTVADEPVETVVDGTGAVKVDAHVDSTVTRTLHQNTEVRSRATQAAGNASSILALAGEGSSVYAIPVEAGELSAREFTYRTTHSPKDSMDSLYNLAFNESDGIPADLGYVVASGDLASVKTKYHGLGGGRSGYTSACATYDGQDIVFCHLVPADFPTERTQYYTTGAELDWRNIAEYHGETEDDHITVEQAVAHYRPGPAERVSGAGPFGPQLRGGGILRDGDDIIVNVSHFENPAADEFIAAPNLTGSTMLSKNGQVIDRADEPSADVAVPEGDSGRYTLSVDTAMETAATALGTKGFAEWEFESEPVGDFTPIDLSSVVFEADGVVDGSAPAGGTQRFTLDYLPQDGAAGADAEELTFEVSHDDGETWRKVDVDREGNTASGTLKHPAGAKYVSYRTAASDDSGNEFHATSIRSYALN